MTSEHWFILIVPWGRVLGWGHTTRRHREKVLSGEVSRRAHLSHHMVFRSSHTIHPSINFHAKLGTPHADITVWERANVLVRAHCDICVSLDAYCSTYKRILTSLNLLFAPVALFEKESIALVIIRVILGQRNWVVAHTSGGLITTF